MSGRDRNATERGGESAASAFRRSLRAIAAGDFFASTQGGARFSVRERCLGERLQCSLFDKHFPRADTQRAL
jgi:hypothetical protein